MARGKHNLLLLLIYIVFIENVHSTINILWSMDLSNICNSTDSDWTCSSDAFNRELIPMGNNTQCNNIACFELKKHSFIQRKITLNSTNQYHLKLNYTLALTELEIESESMADYFYVYLITDDNTSHTLQTYDSITNMNATQITLSLSDSLITNQSFIFLKFELLGTHSDDYAYLYSAMLYHTNSSDIYTVTQIPSLEPTLEPTLESESEDKIAFGTEYKDRYMLILAGSMFGGAVFIILYFRCCKKKYEARKARKIEQKQKQMEMQQMLNEENTDVELVQKDNEKVVSDSEKVKKDKKRNDKLEKVLAASPSDTTDVDFGSENE